MIMHADHPPAFLLALTVVVVGASVVLATLAYLPTGPHTVFPVASESSHHSHAPVQSNGLERRLGVSRLAL